MKPVEEKPLATVADVAFHLQLSERTVRSLITSGRIRHHRIPGTRLIRVPWDAIQEFLGDGETLQRRDEDLGAFIGRATSNSLRNRDKK